MNKVWDYCTGCGSECGIELLHIPSGLCPQCKIKNVQNIDEAIDRVLEKYKYNKETKSFETND